MSVRSVKTIATPLALALATLGLAAGTASAATATTGPTPPTISDLPSIVKAGAGSDAIAVAFPSSPSANTLRAAIVAASAFSGLSGHGVTVMSVIDPSQAELTHSPVSVIEMDPRPGPATLSLSYLEHGNLLLKLSGEGRPLVNAAKLLSTRWISALGSSRTTLTGSLTAAVAHLQATGGRETLAPGSVSSGSDGPLTISRQIDIPVDKVINQAQALLRLGVEYDAPGGGRLTFRLNGYTIGAAESRGHGNSFDYRFRIASIWTDGPNLQPGYYLNPGENTITVTATPSDRKLASQVGTQLALTPESDIQMHLSQRRTQEQLDLWPFPLYDGSWADTTVVMHPASTLSRAALSALISALANTERLTGTPADPQISYSKPSRAQQRGNLLVFGDPENVAGIRSAEPVVAGLITEQRLPHGGTALLITDGRAMGAFGGEYYPGIVQGQTVIIDNRDHAHTIVSAAPPQAFGSPAIPWLKPAAGIAALVLMWLAVRVFLARRRLRERPDMPSGGVLS